MDNPVQKIKIYCEVNGQPCVFHAAPMMRLLDVLRDDAKLTGCKEGCGEGECGACSVIFDGELVNSCLVPIAQCEGARITTIEGIAPAGQLHALQDRFVGCNGTQCGICTPGMILAAVVLLRKTPHPTEIQVREALSGNLCRCTGYTKIFESVLSACRDMGVGA
jgi:carbon-monoxide dehydrogenase small subunit